MTMATDKYYEREIGYIPCSIQRLDY